MQRYRPLDGRTIFAMIAVGLAIFAAFASDLTGLAFAGDESDVALMMTGGLGLVQFFSFVLAAIAVCVWMHCAASNLRAFGNPYLNFTPGGSVGWWFVPFANFVKPFQAMSEIVRASDPAGLGQGFASDPTALLGFWWATWIGSNVIANVSMRIDDAEVSSTVSLLSSLLWTVAGVLLIMIMRRVTAHQAEVDRRLQPAVPVPYAPYRGPGGY